MTYWISIDRSSRDDRRPDHTAGALRIPACVRVSRDARGVGGRRGPRRSFDPFGFRLGGRLRPARDRLTADHAILPGRWATVGGSRAPIVTAMGSLIDVSTWAAGAASTGAATASARDRREAAPHAAGDAARTPSARP